MMAIDVNSLLIGELVESLLIFKIFLLPKNSNNVAKEFLKRIQGWIQARPEKISTSHE